METYQLKLTLKSDAAFGRGDGVAGLVDTEVEHDRYGLPYMRGRTLKGLLAEACADILFSLEKAQVDVNRWHDAAQTLFGRPGSTLSDSARLHVGRARLPADLRNAVIVDIVKVKRYTSDDVLDSLTAIRQQTAMDESGKPETGTLRTTRVVLRETPFEAALRFLEPPTEDALALLVACTLAVRRAGTGRNRGYGRVTARLYDANGNDVTDEHLQHFRQGVRE
jgi:hypothetical protein